MIKKESFNKKIFNKNEKVYNNFKLIYLYNLFFKTKYIIYFNYKQMLNKDIYLLKNELYKLKVESYVLLKKDKEKIFNIDFKFLGGFMFCIFINDYDIFLKIYHILFEKKILYFFSFKKLFSNIINEVQLLGGKVFIIINFLIYKLI